MKILALTSIRSDYDLLSPLYALLKADTEIEFKLIVSGAHLSKDFGYTLQDIQKDGFEILVKLETLVQGDSYTSRLKTASIFLQNSIDIVSHYNPDLLLYAGDREDVIMGSLLGTYLNIPTIHFYGGDHELDGHQDTYIRHATSKLSTLHFVASQTHQKRLEAMGEESQRIFNIGAISLDRLKNFQEQELQHHFEKKIPKNFALLIYHPIANEDPSKTFSTLLELLKKENIFTFVSFPNTDPNYTQIIKHINLYRDDDNFIFYKNLPREIFLTIFKNCSFLIGNSSAGIYEATTFQKGVINVGLRQKNHLITDNTIYVSTNKKEIAQAIQTVLSKPFQNSLKKISNIFGDGKSALKAYKLIKKLNFKNYLPKFYDPLTKEKNGSK